MLFLLLLLNYFSRLHFTCVVCGENYISLIRFNEKTPLWALLLTRHRYCMAAQSSKLLVPFEAHTFIAVRYDSFMIPVSLLLLIFSR